MIELTNLESQVLSQVLTALLPKNDDVMIIIGELRIKKRSFSAEDSGFCSGFYTDFEENQALKRLKIIPHDFSVQAKCERLSHEEMGVIVFCDSVTRSISAIEAFFYGDDRMSVDELLKEKNSFSVYTLSGL